MMMTSLTAFKGYDFNNVGMVISVMNWTYDRFRLKSTRFYTVFFLFPIIKSSSTAFRVGPLLDYGHIDRLYYYNIHF